MAEPTHARRLWWALEPYHAVVYFAPDAKSTYEAIGLKGFWMGYFASRAAPLGPVPAEVVTATFFNFHPAMVARAIPDAWQLAPSVQIIETRLDHADRTLRDLLGETRLRSSELAEAAALARRAAEAARPQGRPLFAAYQALEWPTEPHLVLWHAATLLREHRGDGHVAALVHADLTPCQAHLLAVASGTTTRPVLDLSRRWTEADWDEARAQLQQPPRGWLDTEGALTPAGIAARQALEDHTDRLAEQPLGALSETQLSRLIETSHQIGQDIIAAGGVPFPNPMGLPDPRGLPAPRGLPDRLSGTT